mmetsp:Transcript_20124/g.47093  ORF Transcript_20124/g.47093 Transcript_20124/m.47093 type:complete len:217 (-) Transcript_20124:1106-1756(-)
MDPSFAPMGTLSVPPNTYPQAHRIKRPKLRLRFLTSRSGLKIWCEQNADRTVRDELTKIVESVARAISTSIMAWYRAASIGLDPPRIWPVIMPGMLTIPTTHITLSEGVAPFWIACASMPETASYCVPPKLRYRSTSARRSTRDVVSVSRAIETPLMELPSNIPTIGMRYRGFHRGFGFNTTPKAQSTIQPTFMARDFATTYNWSSWAYFVRDDAS